MKVDYILTWLFVFLGLVLGIDIAITMQHNIAAKTECAQFNPKTGDFEWINNDLYGTE